MAPSAARLLVALCVAAACSRHAAALCAYGSEPGTWTNMHWVVRTGRYVSNHNYNRLDNSSQSLWLDGSLEPAGTPFGAAWRTLRPACALRNLVAPYWPGGGGGGRDVSLLLVGDSIDSQLLNHLCAEFAARGGAGWNAFVHSHRVVNYCRLPGGPLRVAQQYLLRFSLEEDLARVAELAALYGPAKDDSPAERLFDGVNRSALEGRAEEVAGVADRPPDVVVLGSAYWSLHHFVGLMSKEGREHTPELLTPDYLASFAETTGAVARALRAAFPRARLALRTSLEIVTDCATGSHVGLENKRIWGKRAYIAQLNAAMRLIAADQGLELVDFEQMGAAFQARVPTRLGVWPGHSV